jgi:DNA-binding IclR family transcriptional regulator
MLPEPKPTESPGSVPALDRSLDILELLSASPVGKTLSELSAELGFPKNAVFRITQTLMARGYIVRDTKTMQFYLTPRMMRLAPPRWGGVSLPMVARPVMMELRDVTRETIQLGVLSGLEGIVIDQVEGLEALRIVVDLGLRFPLYNNGPGKLLLAHMKKREREAALKKMELVRCTSRTITDKDELRQECAGIVERGYSVDHAEADEGIHCFAAPIYGVSREVAGTLWITGPAKRLPESRFEELGARVSAAGEEISRRIMELG